jgi:hypothetical protein
MKTPISMRPQPATLAARLTSTFKNNAVLPAPLEIINRKLPRMMSTFPNEVVTCRFANGRKRRLFLKYEGGHNHDSYGHRGGVSYEAKVYQQILSDYPDFRPRCFGAHTDSQSGESWLVLEYLDGCARVIEVGVEEATREPVEMIHSARWIARFHAAHETMAGNGAPLFLKRYDEHYYAGWCRRSLELTRPLHAKYPWLPELCRQNKKWISLLLNASVTLIHGEFYGKTIFFKNNTVFPVDWESAALGAGEIDLAALTEGSRWPERVVERCLQEYRETRWPGGTPPHFQPTLDAARIYLHFRWLGERQDWVSSPKLLWRYEHLKIAGERLGLV